MVVTPLVIATCALWLRSQFVTKQEFGTAQERGTADRADIRNRIDTAERRLDDHRTNHEGRILALEKEVSRAPTRHTLNNELMKLGASIAGIERTITGLTAQHQTTQDYLKVMIERGLDR